MYNHCWFSATPVRLKSSLYFPALMSKPALFRLPMFHIPNLIYIFLKLGLFIKIHPSVMPFVTFSNRIFLMRSSLSHSQPPNGGPSIVSCPRFLIQYIHSYISKVCQGSEISIIIALIVIRTVRYIEIIYRK